MRAAVLKARGCFEIDPEYPDGRLSPTDIRLRVSFSGICGSDLHEFVAGPLLAPMPAVLGHEFCGEVIELGSEARGFDLGDKAVGIVYPGCGRCDYCRQGDFTLCDMRALGIAERSGSFAESVVAPARQMFLIPAETAPEEAAVIEPVSVACHAIRRSRLGVGERVVVMGAGPLGLLIMMLSQRAGAHRVAVVEPTPGRRELARKLGADLVLDPADEIEGPIMELTGARGADVVFEVSGSAQAFTMAQQLVRKQGRLMMVAVYEARRLELQANRMLGNEVDILPSFWANEIDFRRAIDLVASRKLDVRPLITARYPLEDLQKAFEILAADRGSQAKIIVACS